MAYRFTRRKSVARSVRRIARQEIRKAIRDLSTSTELRHIGIHEARKRLKKLRSLLRLVRKPMRRQWTAVDTLLRDIGRGLAAARDAEAVVESLDTLLRESAPQSIGQEFAPIQALLVARRDELIGAIDVERRQDEAAAALASLAGCVDDWRLGRAGLATVNREIRRCYASARRAMDEAFDSGQDERFHRWRKCVKHHAHHVRLLGNLWRPVMDAFSQQLEQLGDLLGHDHDLSALRAALSEPRFAGEPAAPALLALIDRRRATVRAAARELGARLFAERPRELAERIAHYWKAWRSHRKPPRKLQAVWLDGR